MSQQRGGWSALGELIRQQRELAAVSMRQLAERVGISGPYLSQIERGLRAPSEAVLQGLAEALHTSADALYEQAGFTEPEAEETAPAESDVVRVIRADTELTGAQRRALTEVYTAFLEANRVRRRSTPRH